MQSFVITLLICSVIMSALALLYMLVTPLLAKRYSEKGRYYAWLVIVIGLIIPFRPQFDNAFVKVDVLSETTTPVIQIGNGIPLTIPIGNATLSPATSSISWWQIVAVVWVAGVIIFLAYHSIKHYRFTKMARRWSESTKDKQTLTLLQSLKTEMGISKQISLELCSSVGSPMMIAFANPRILLPKTEFAQDELRFILKHELVHYKRKDLWYKCLVLIATAVHWFNPIVYLMAKAIDVQCEFSCDAEIVRSADVDTRQHYSETIIGIVKYQSKLKTALSTNFYGGKKGMKKRIFSIMDTGKKRAGIAVICGVLLITLGTGFAFAANAAINNNENPSTRNVSYDGIDITGKSDNYKLIVEMGKLDTSMSIAEYNATLVSMAETAGTNIYQLMADVLDEIFKNAGYDTVNDDEFSQAINDPMYQFMSGILAHSNSELYASEMGGDEVPFVSSDASIYEDEYVFDANYELVYNITDETGLTIAEREKRFSAIIEGIQLYVDGLSESELFDTSIGDNIYLELKRLVEEYNDDKMFIEINREYIHISGYSGIYGDIVDE